jgi:hypothetical protein
MKSILDVMPNGVYPLPKLNPISPVLRLRVQLHHLRLDDELAHGADPHSSPELALRADQLMRGRERIAVAIERALDSARRPGPVFSARVPVRRDQALECSSEILALTERLREDPIDVRGVAMASRLVHDGASALYLDGGPSLLYTVRSARLALDPIGERFYDVPVAA